MPSSAAREGMNVLPPGSPVVANSAPVRSPTGQVDELAGLRLLTNQLFSLLSHDLRTPLSAISGWLYLLESDKLDPKARRRALVKIRANVEQQVQLIDDTFLLSCCKTGHLQLDLQKISPRLPLSAAVDSIRVAAQTKGFDLPAITGGTNAVVRADAKRLQRVFELLLCRAISNTPAGGTVATSVLRHDDCVEVVVANDGAGFAEAALPFVLDPGGVPDATPGRSGKSPERGLLLASALVEAHGGRLRVASAGENMGATFTVALPLPSD